MRDQRGTRSLQPASRAFSLQKHTRFEHEQPVKGFVHQASEVTSVEREEDVGPGQGAEQNRPVFGSVEYSRAGSLSRLLREVRQCSIRAGLASRPRLAAGLSWPFSEAGRRSKSAGAGFIRQPFHANDSAAKGKNWRGYGQSSGLRGLLFHSPPSAVLLRRTGQPSTLYPPQFCYPVQWGCADSADTGNQRHRTAKRL